MEHAIPDFVRDWPPALPTADGGKTEEELLREMNEFIDLDERVGQFFRCTLGLIREQQRWRAEQYYRVIRQQSGRSQPR